MKIKLPQENLRDRKHTTLHLDLIQTCTMIKPNKIKGDISRIRDKPPQGLINPPFKLLKPKRQRLNQRKDSIWPLY